MPKGLEATVASVNSSLSAVQEMFSHGDGDNILVFLRLALLQQRYWIYSALINGHDITLSDLDRAIDTARTASPTVIMGVPGFYEELHARLQAALPSDDPMARGTAIQAALGGRIRYLWTGSAPASRAVLQFFNDAGVPLYEGYGLNETCIVAKNHPGAFRLGSVGKVLPHISVRFDKDGILIVGSRSPVNCRYTWCADGANEKAFLPTGEVKTYDLGHVDDDGFLYIHGRVDDILTLSSGRNVLVRLIEEKLREHPSVQECVLFGNGKSFLSAIVSPDVGGTDVESLKDHILAMNKSLLPEQRIHAVLVAQERFSIYNGLLTSQYKPKRNDIYRRHAAELAVIYEDGRQPGALLFMTAGQHDVSTTNLH
jgi:long-chain acyl-CoA synthetase